MKIACILTANELSNTDTSLIVFPEGVNRKEIKQAQSSHTGAMIVGATVENDFIRGVLLHRGKNQIDYLKVETDGRTKGSCDADQKPLYEFENLCIGILICKDIDNVGFSKAVIDGIKSSSAELKLLCIPADMGSYWLSGDSLPSLQKYQGINVIVCNHIKTHQDRCKSFITDTQSRKIIVQQNREPIYAELP